MSQRYHVNAKGVAGQCRASQGNCPFGGKDEHYATREDAQKAYEESKSSQFVSHSRSTLDPGRLANVPLPKLSLQEMESLISDERAKGKEEVITVRRSAKNGLKKFFSIDEEYQVKQVVPTEKMKEIDEYIKLLPPRAKEARNVYLAAEESERLDPSGASYNDVKEAAEKVYRQVIDEVEEHTKRTQEHTTQSMKNQLFDRLMSYPE